MWASFTKVATTITLLIAMQGAAAGAAPLRDTFHVDFTETMTTATAVCGFDIFGHFEGNARFTLFYDRNGNIIGETDTYASFKVTVWAPSTGKSYTSASPAVLHVQYTDGAKVGSIATFEETGLLEKFDGVALAGGRVVFEEVITEVDPAGIPLSVTFVREISASGPQAFGPFGDLRQLLAVARCNAMK